MKNAWVFPGQGSQHVGMLAQLAESFTEVKTTFSQASESLGYDLWQLVQQDEQKLNQTQYTQPALLAASIAYWRILANRQLATAQFLAGHSLGEYSALVAAQALDFSDAIKLVSLRGEVMQAAVQAGEGAMAAVLGLSDQQVIEICAELSGEQVLAAVNFNAPGQVVIAGHRQAVERAEPVLQAAGARKVLLLPVSVPSHCALMLPAAEQLKDALFSVEIYKPTVPVIHNVDVSEHQQPEAIRIALVNQLSRPVRWVETIQSLADLGVERFVECGPGKVLTGLNKRIVKAAKHAHVAHLVCETAEPTPVS